MKLSGVRDERQIAPYSVDSPTAPILAAQVVNLQNTNHSQPIVPVIPRPKGNSYSLQEKMGLEDDPEKYDVIRVRRRSPFLL